MAAAQGARMCPDHLPGKPKIGKAVTGAPVELTSHPVELARWFHYDRVCKALREAGGKENPQLFFKKLISIPAVISPG